MGEDFVLELGRHVTRGREPDRVILLDIDVEAAAGRLLAQPQPDDRIEVRGAGYFRRVADAYRRYADRAPGRFVVVDAAASPDDVATRVREALEDVV